MMDTAPARRGSRVTLVVPVYNEAVGLEHNLSAIMEWTARLDGVDTRVLLVDDGSRDDTAALAIALRERWPNLSVLCLTRHFGKEAAIQAGLEHADADAVVVMDSDLQHPPSLLPRMVELWRNGAAVVETYKTSRERESFASRVARRGFYRMLRVVGAGDIEQETDFKLLDRQAVDAYLALPERGRFFRGLVQWMGYDAARIPFEVPSRLHGRSRWSTWSLVRLSLVATTSFSAVPLQCVTLLGIVTFAVSLVLGGKAIYDKATGQAIGGFTTVILLLLFIGSVLMVSLGLLGVYVARIFDEIKARPRYVANWRKSRL